MNKLFIDKRKEFEMNQTEFAKVLKITQSCVSKIESGNQVPSLLSFANLAIYLGLDIGEITDYLFEISE